MARGGLVLAALVVLVAALAGTSAAVLSPKEYKAQLAKLGQESSASQVLVQNGLQSKSVPKLKSALLQFAKAQDKVAGEVAALKPPKNAAAANSELAKGLHDIAKAVRGVVAKMSAAKTVAQATAILNKDQSGAKAGGEVDTAITKLRKLGYS